MVELDELGKRELARIAEAPNKFLDYVKSIEDARPKYVIDKILKDGYCTMETLEERYGHGPRAARDVREKGIDLKTERYKAASGKSLAVYHFGDFDYDVMSSKTNGRNVLSDALKEQLINEHGAKCFIYLEDLPVSKLQIDHRVPYEIAGEQDETDTSNFMLLSAAANRSKSWECEHCPNWDIKDIERCKTCFWASPECYTHTACRKDRLVALALQDESAVAKFDALVKANGINWVTDKLKAKVEEWLADRL